MKSENDSCMAMVTALVLALIIRWVTALVGVYLASKAFEFEPNMYMVALAFVCLNVLHVLFKGNKSRKE